MAFAFFGAFRARWVEATFWLDNTAVILRVLPLVLPPAFVEWTPAGGRLVHAAFGLSGLIALGDVVCLALNLWWTARSSILALSRK